MLVIGLGAQDDLELARDFIAKTGTRSFPMVWDKSFDSWRHYGIQINSQTWLLDRFGNRVGAKRFGFDEKTLLAAVRAL